ncbi:MAG: RNA ligase RtcB family protein [Pseudomonadota bacterium]
MGNPLGNAARGDRARVQYFYTSSTWIEGKAIEQLDQVANQFDVKEIAAFPDLHPGKYGPVGCALSANRIYPQLIGNDIGCGMSVFVLDLPARKLRVDKAAERLRVLEAPWEGDTASALAEAGLPLSLHDGALGSIGGGNHFCEVQAVHKIHHAEALASLGIDKNSILLMVHSGSRSLGASVFGSVQNFINGLLPGSDDARVYLKSHDHAVRWASLNRRIIAERAASALRTVCDLAVDSPHNLIEPFDGAWLHRKGAAKADVPLVPLAGSRDAFSFLLQPTDKIDTALHSLAHGAGRKYDRRSMAGRVGNTRSDRDRLERTSFGGRVVCEDRQLLLEEAPEAYKDPTVVARDLEHFGLVEKALTMKPLITFKKALAEKALQRETKQATLLQRRRDR